MAQEAAAALPEGAAPVVPLQYGRPLVAAAHTGDVAWAQQCLQDMVGMPSSAVQAWQEEALHCASEAGHVDVVRLLLNCPGANRQQVSQALDRACPSGDARTGDTQLIRLLVTARKELAPTPAELEARCKAACRAGQEGVVCALMAGTWRPTGSQLADWLGSLQAPRHARVAQAYRDANLRARRVLVLSR